MTDFKSDAHSASGPTVPAYAGTVADYGGRRSAEASGALVTAVVPESPADDLGIEPGMRIVTVNGHALTDMIVWLWETDGLEAELEVYDPRDNPTVAAVIARYPGEE